MNRVGRAALMLCIGVITARLLWTGTFGWFVQQRMRWPLVLAAIVLILFGIYEAVSGSREEEQDSTASKRSAGPTIGWMMIVPMLVLVSVAPTGLGAAAADRVDAYVPTEATSDEFEPLDSSAGPVEMTVFDFLDRAAWDNERSLEDVTVRLAGLVVNDPEIPDGFKLTRFLVSCCAADGIPLQVSLRNTPIYADDTWVEADVVWSPPEVPYQDQGGAWTVEARVVSISEVADPPNDAYESPY